MQLTYPDSDTSFVPLATKVEKDLLVFSETFVQWNINLKGAIAFSFFLFSFFFKSWTSLLLKMDLTFFFFSFNLNCASIQRR